MRFICVFLYTLEDLKWHEFNKLKLYKTIEPDANIVKPFIINNSFGIFLSSKSALFVNVNDVANKKTDPYKQDDKIIWLSIVFIYNNVFK